jgi:uncharacterized protein (TIGR03437 family)
VNALVPATVRPGSAQVVVFNGSADAAPYPVQVEALRPAMLSLPPGYSPQSSYIAAVFPDFLTYALPPDLGYPNVATRRAKAGDTVVLFGMGFGAVTPNVPDGQIAGGANSLASQVAVTFTRTSAPVAGKVTYAGLMPGTVGLYQFNVAVPEIDIPAGLTSDDFVLVDVTVNGQHLGFPPALTFPYSK